MTDKITTSIIWQEADLDTVMRFFSNGFELKKTQRIISVQYFLDGYLRKVVFKMIVTEG